MLIVLADDFSGATEIGGIANTNGLKVQIQKNFEVNDNLDVIIIDLDSRKLDAKDALTKTKFVSEKVNIAYPQAFHFKKVDSVFRGHISEEIRAQDEIHHFNRILVLPTNPSANRIIKTGEYFIDVLPLNKTQFASDPEFPRNTSFIRELFVWNGELSYFHFNSLNEPNTEKWIGTSDIKSLVDIRDILKWTDKSNLVAGSGDTFRCFLEHHSLNQGSKKKVNIVSDYQIMINGSTIINHEELDFISLNKIPKLEMKELIVNFENWSLEIAEVLNVHSQLSIYAPKTQNLDSDIILDLLAKTANFIAEHLKNKTIHFILTGGATASAILEQFKAEKFSILNEWAAGVVSCRDPKNNRIIFTIKPGSYSWGERVLEDLYDKK
jgi:hypothetical protein